MTKRTPAKYYIGIASGFHDAAIALVNEQGEVVFAQATERFTQNKRALTTVADNYFYSEQLLGAFPMTDYELAVNWKLLHSITKYLISAAAIFAIRHYNTINRLLSKYVFRIKDVNLFRNVADFQASTQFGMITSAGASFKYHAYLKSGLAYKSNHYFDHHTCHAYYSFFCSGFKDALILVLDGNGDDNSSYSLFRAHNQTVEQIFKNPGRASLGDYYAEITKWCGFSEISGEQWKVMGLAPYGSLNEELLNDLKAWLYIDGITLKRNKIALDIKSKIDCGNYADVPKKDIAYTCQFFYEQLVIELINSIYKKYPHQHLIITGGCALNSAANGKVHTHTPFKQVFIPPAPGDDGCAVGAALLNFRLHNPQSAIPHFQTNPYSGFTISDYDLELFINNSGYRYSKEVAESLCRKVAAYINEGKIIAWVQGAAEFGPRALGNRSILANPCLPDMKDRINALVKFREEFRPFAPSVLEEYASDYFENYHPTPYMERVLQIVPGKQSQIPAVTHVDGSGRLQTVSASLNPVYHQLISEFYKLSGVPIVLNTSLNVMGKPIVNSVADIAAVFATSGIDVLVINNYIITKPTV